MGSLTRVYNGYNGYAQFYVTYAYPDSIKVSGSTFSYEDLLPTSMWAAIVWSHSVGVLTRGTVNVSFSLGGSYQYWNSSPSDSGYVAWSGSETKGLYKIRRSGSTKQISSIFNSSNPNDAYVVVSSWTQYGSGQALTNYESFDSSASFGDTIPVSQKIYLDAPPTFKTTDSGGAESDALYFDTNYVYTGLTTASIKVANLSAKYGGNISDVTLKIGNQTASRSDAGELSILLDTVGTFTPTVTVTDSRGQTTTKQLDPITVSGYEAPRVSFTAERTLQSGQPDDEGTYAVLDATFTFTDVVAEAYQPSVVMTDENGTQTTPTVTWFSSRAADGTLSGSVTWANLSSGDTVYGRVPNLNTQYSYSISVRPRDKIGSTVNTGTAISQTVPPAFYTIDFYAGGHGIAFGRPANSNGFYSAMTAEFEDTATFGADVLIDLPEYQTASTTDKAIYDAIVALGWDSDVLIP